MRGGASGGCWSGSGRGRRGCRLLGWVEGGTGCGMVGGVFLMDIMRWDGMANGTRDTGNGGRDV